LFPKGTRTRQAGQLLPLLLGQALVQPLPDLLKEVELVIVQRHGAVGGAGPALRVGAAVPQRRIDLAQTVGAFVLFDKAVRGQICRAFALGSLISKGGFQAVALGLPRILGRDAHLGLQLIEHVAWMAQEGLHVSADGLLQSFALDAQAVAAAFDDLQAAKVAVAAVPGDVLLVEPRGVPGRSLGIGASS